MENVVHSCPSKNEPELVSQLAAYYLHLIGFSWNALLLFFVQKYSGENTGAYRTIYRMTCMVDVFIIIASIAYQQILHDLCLAVDAILVVAFFGYVLLLLLNVKLLLRLSSKEPTSVPRMGLIIGAIAPLVIMLLPMSFFLALTTLEWNVSDQSGALVTAMTTLMATGNPLAILFAGT
ncbi:hypothetical protein AAVH_26973 [Aphelenchoides avenae]|nr:hypothetical protein AAVH_26973 [Aphelenchus avenae]